MADTTATPAPDQTEPTNVAMPETSAETAPAKLENPGSPESPENPESPESPEIPEKPEKKRRIRTRTLFAAALVLGVVGGVAGGYAVQAKRQPTPLPPLNVAAPVYPRGPVYDGIRPSPLPANADDATIADGDLTKLLLPTPAGARATVNDHGWMTLADEADTCAKPAGCFSTDVNTGVARIADTAWNRPDGIYVEIRIFQYLPGHSDVPDNGLDSFLSAGGKTLTLPAGIPAVGYEYKDDHGDNNDHALAVHGSLAVYFWVTSPTRVPDPSIVGDLITQQMARL